MLERLLKPTVNGDSKDQLSVRRSLKRPRDETSPTDTKPDIDSIPTNNQTPRATTNGTEKPFPIKMEPPTPSVEKIDADLSEFADDDMDFSILDDEENQFNDHVVETSETKEPNVKAEQIKAELLKKETENFEKLMSNWENNFTNENDDDDELLGSIDVDATQATFTSSVDGKSTMKFWYWDAFEDPIKLPGKIFLFGKMVSDKNPKEFKSVCITVENVNRCLYFLPRKYVSFKML